MNNSIATFAGGCFWCTEAVFLALNGVKNVAPGYIGGNIENPTYQQVCDGKTGHAEAVQIEFDSDQISFEKLLEVFFKTHDPTTLNRQGADVGTQYRSEIFCHNEAQRELALNSIEYLTKEKVFSDPIVTTVSNSKYFYKAEDYHHNYYNQHKEQSYCSYVIAPKLRKLENHFATLLK